MNYIPFDRNLTTLFTDFSCIKVTKFVLQVNLCHKLAGSECVMCIGRLARQSLAWQQWSFLSKWKLFQLHLGVNVFSGTSTTTYAILRATFLVTIFAWRTIL